MFKTPWLVMPMLIALVILPRLSTDLYLSSLPNIGAALNASDASMRMTLTIFMFGYALSMLITGPLLDQFGRKRILMYGLSIFLIATLACATAHSIIVLIVARFFQALGGCCGTVVARVMVKEAYRHEEQLKILSYLSAAMAICPLLIPILGGSLQIVFGWRATFYLLGVIGLFLFLTTQQQLNEYPSPADPFSVKILVTRYKTLLTHRLFIGYSLAISFAWCNYFAFTLESPFLLQKTLGFNSIKFGILFAITILGYLVGTQVTKRYSSSVNWDKLIFIGTLFCLIGAVILTCLVMSFPLHWIIVILPMTIIMIGVGIIIPCSQAAVMQPFSKIVGTASGLFFFIQMAFGGLCGLLMQSLNFNNALSMSLVILVSSILLVLSFYKLIMVKKMEPEDLQYKRV